MQLMCWTTIKNQMLHCPFVECYSFLLWLKNWYHQGFAIHHYDLITNGDSPILNSFCIVPSVLGIIKYHIKNVS
jgi:hypothetical protein